MTFYVNPFTTLDVSFVSKVINALYEANVERLELEMLERQNILTLKAYQLYKYFCKLVDRTQFPILKILQSKLKPIWINLCVYVGVLDNENCKNNV
jgi:hypothetical protein